MVRARQLVSSSVSIIGLLSTIICLLALAFYFLVIPPKKRNALNTVCCFITFADLCSSCGLIFGFSQDRTYICQAQAFLTNIGPLWSMFWTLRAAVIVLEIIHRNQNYSPESISTTPSSLSISSRFTFPLSSPSPTNQRESNFESSFHWHIFCWIWPLILSLLILTTNRYGCGGDEDICWCFIANRSNSPDWTQAFWTISAFYFWVWSSILIFTLVFFAALYQCRQYRKSSLHISVDEVIIRTLLPYLLVLVICWIYPTIFDVAVAIDPNSILVTSHLSLLIASILPTLQGLLTGIIFIRSTIRQFYSQLLVLPSSLPTPDSNRQLACVHNQNISEMVSLH
jgi:hypothetical protein